MCNRRTTTYNRYVTDEKQHIIEINRRITKHTVDMLQTTPTIHM